MLIYILTTQEDVANRIADRFTELYDYDVKVFTSPMNFCISAAECKPGELDLLAADYLSFKTDDYNPFADMKSVNKVYPFIFYNSPFPSSEDRVNYWYKKIIRNMSEYLPELEKPKLIKLLEQFNYIITRDDIFPYIKLFCEPPKMEVFQGVNEKFISEFCRRHKIRAVKYELFKFFISHLGQELHENTICNFLWNDCSKKNVNLLYTYIRGLRKCCDSDNVVKLYLEHPKKWYYRMILCH